MPTLPRDLNRLARGYAIDGPGGVMRTEVGGGRPRYGLEWDRGTQSFQIQMLMNPSQWMAWTLFYHRVIKKGAIMFDMVLNSGAGPETHQVNIIPNTLNVGGREGQLRLVSFAVEAESTAYDVSDEDIEDFFELYDEYGAGLFAFINRLAIFANIDTTVAFRDAFRS